MDNRRWQKGSHCLVRELPCLEFRPGGSVEAATCASEGRGASVVQLRGGRSCRSRNENGSRTALKPAVTRHSVIVIAVLRLLKAGMGTRLVCQLNQRVISRLIISRHTVSLLMCCRMHDLPSSFWRSTTAAKSARDRVADPQAVHHGGAGVEAEPVDALEPHDAAVAVDQVCSAAGQDRGAHRLLRHAGTQSA